MMALIISLIIPFLIWGPFFPDLIVSLSTLAFLYYIFKNKFFYYFNNKPLILFFIFCVYCTLVSIFIADDILLSFESSLFFFRIGIFTCVIWYLIEKDKKILQYFYYSIIICFLILVIDGYFQYFTGFNLFGLPINGVRVSSFFGDELIMGSYLSRLFPLLFALFIIKKKKIFELYLIGSLFILVDILIFVSGERTAFAFLNISTIFIIILIKDYQKFRLITFIIAFTFIIILTVSNPGIKDRMVSHTIEYSGFDEKEKKKFIFTPVHDSLIRTAYNMFKDKPFFGHGPKMFRVKCKDEKYAIGISPCATHPGNFYVQLLAETGVIGFLFLFSTLCYLMYCSYKQLKSIIFNQKRYLTDYQVCLLAAILLTIWPFSPNGNFFNNWLAICYSLPVGFYLHSIYGKNKKEIL